MKKILTYAAPLAMALGFSAGLSAPAAAKHGDPHNGVTILCKHIINELGGTIQFIPPDGFIHHFDNVGQCVSFIRSATNPSPITLCKSIDTIVGVEALGFKNFGQCVKALKDS